MKELEQAPVTPSTRRWKIGRFPDHRLPLGWLVSALVGLQLNAGLALAQTTAPTRQATQHANPHAAAGRNHSASKTVLVLGDSLSAEYGLTRGAGWVPLLEQRLRSRNITAPIVNASISGETTSGGRARLQALLESHHPDIVIIELGGNDALRGLPISATQANLRAMIDACEKVGARVLLAGMQIPPNYGPAYARQFAGIYPALAKQTGSALVPFFLEGLQTRLDLFQSDRIHPVAAAQPILLDNVWPHLTQMLGQAGRNASKAGTARTASPADMQNVTGAR